MTSRGPSDLAGEWVLERMGRAGRERAVVRFETAADVVRIHVPWLGPQGLHAAMVPSERGLAGRYSLAGSFPEPDAPFAPRIVIEHNGDELIARVHGFPALENWRLWRPTAEDSDVPDTRPG